MSWETVYSWSQILVVIFAGFALVSGLIVNKRQSREIASANERTAKLEKETADARLELAKIDPVNRPITNLTGYARIEIKAEDDPQEEDKPKQPSLSIKGGANLRLQSGASKSFSEKLERLAIFMLGRSTDLNQRGEHRFALQVSGEIRSEALDVENKNRRFDVYLDQQDVVMWNTSGLTTAELDIVAIEFLPSIKPSPFFSFKVVGGTVKLTINSSISREFTISPQEEHIRNIATSDVTPMK